MVAATKNISGTSNIATFMRAWSATRPRKGGDHRSPNRWMKKMHVDIAVARNSAGTLRRIAILTGPLKRKRQVSDRNDHK
jgi:hypothetical protein